LVVGAITAIAAFKTSITIIIIADIVASAIDFRIAIIIAAIKVLQDLNPLVLKNFTKLLISGCVH